jgi:hypothetical protein
MTLNILAGPKAGGMKTLKVRCDTLDNFDFFTTEWALQKKD